MGIVVVYSLSQMIESGQSPAVLVYEDPAKSPLYRRSHVGDKR